MSRLLKHSSPVYCIVRCGRLEVPIRRQNCAWFIRHRNYSRKLWEESTIVESAIKLSLEVFYHENIETQNIRTGTIVVFVYSIDHWHSIAGSMDSDGAVHVFTGTIQWRDDMTWYNKQAELNVLSLLRAVLKYLNIALENSLPPTWSIVYVRIPT